MARQLEKGFIPFSCGWLHEFLIAIYLKET